MYINTRYVPVKGLKQWWIYDEVEDIYIDPPVEVLNKAKTFSEEEEYLIMILQYPEEYNLDWLFDKNHWCKNIEI